VVIRRSAAREVAGLLRDIAGGADAARDAAVARLSVIGTRAVEGLLALLASVETLPARVGALSALEAIGDPRAVDPALVCLEGAQPDLFGPAASVLRRLLDSPRGAEVLDRLTALVLDPTRPDAARLAAFDALRGLAPQVLQPIANRLRQDESETVRAVTTGMDGLDPILPPLEAIERAAAGTLPDNPANLRRWLAAEGCFAPLPTLHRLVHAIRRHEDTVAPAERGDWMMARGAAHQALAARGSTVALYDLRETIASGDPAPVEMLSALAAIGDRTCLEPIAAAYAKLQGESPQHAWWREHLAASFRAIAARERLSRRHTVARRIASRWPEAWLALFGSPKA
jgi:hypothetical protein